MGRPKNLRLRVLDRKPTIFARVASCLRFLASVPTLCQHRNRNSPSPYMQVCFDCGRTRYFSDRNVPGVWHRDEVR